ncbi:MAG TPA: MraY family glycosyltransferase, partial [Ktedonobacteraceae bacterium]|nr:MraY family glycosyltransferase [Ktedonobacteraceae bacterium]
MTMAYIVYAQLVSLPSFISNNVVLLVLGAACAFLLSYLLTFVVIAVARRFDLLDRSTAERKREHKVPVPRLGGVAMYVAFVVASLLFYVHDPELQHKEFVIYWLLIASATLTVIVNTYDDIKGLKPLPKFIAQTVAVLIILGPWFADMKFHGVLLFGFSNPFGSISAGNLPWFLRPEITLFISPPAGQLPAISLLAIPAVLLTWFWMVGMMNTINWIDGMDGLATGVVGFTALFIAIISWTLGQYTIAILSAIFTGAVLGFLPHNWNPARI